MADRRNPSPTRVVVDTSVWSLALRRRAGALSRAERAIVLHWADLVRDGRAVLIGIVRQEVLTGIREEARFERLRDHLRGFDDEPPSAEDYERAARFANTCRAAGIAEAAVDFLICGVAAGRDLPVFTTDPDFRLYARVLPISLYQPPRRTSSGPAEQED
jgi:predicted nucleic acid-binding protein